MTTRTVVNPYTGRMDMTLYEPDLDPRETRLVARAEAMQERGNMVTGVTTAFPKNPPPPGIAYSKNFARFQQCGPFALQVKD